MPVEDVTGINVKNKDMPIIKSAIKKLRRDKKRRVENDLTRRKLEEAIGTARKKKTDKNVSVAFSLIDRAVKRHLIHKNKANRIKSTLSKVTPKSTTPAQIKTKKKGSTKKVVKKAKIASKK